MMRGADRTAWRAVPTFRIRCKKAEHVIVFGFFTEGDEVAGSDGDGFAFGVGGDDGVEDFLDFGSAGEVGLVLLAGADALDEAGVVVGRGLAGDFLPHGFVEVGADTDFVARGGALGVDLDGAFRAGDFEEEAVGVSAGPAGGVDVAEGAVGELDGEDGGVVGVEDVFADAVALGLVEGFEFAVNGFDRAGGEGGEVHYVDADVAEDAAAAVLGGQAPEPGRRGAPVAPDFAGEPGLEVAGFDVADLADLAGGDHGLDGLDGGPVAVGEVHHVDDTGFLGGGDHLQGVGVVEGEGFFAEDVFAGAEALDGLRGVEGVGRDDGDGVELVPGEQGVHGGEGVRDTVRRGEGGDAFGTDIDGGDEGAAGDGGVTFGVAFGHAAGADDGEADGGGLGFFWRGHGGIRIFLTTNEIRQWRIFWKWRRPMAFGD
jgi:hypothetical protein